MQDLRSAPQQQNQSDTIPLRTDFETVNRAPQIENDWEDKYKELQEWILTLFIMSILGTFSIITFNIICIPYIIFIVVSSLYMCECMDKRSNVHSIYITSIISYVLYTLCWAFNIGITSSATHKIKNEYNNTGEDEAKGALIFLSLLLAVIVIYGLIYSMIVLKIIHKVRIIRRLLLQTEYVSVNSV